VKKLILALALLGSSFANASIYLCNVGNTREAGQLLVIDQVYQKLAIFGKAGSLDSWTLNYGEVFLAAPMQSGDEFVAYGMAEDNSLVDWQQLPPETCYVTKKSTLTIKLRQTTGNQITGRVHWLPNILMNPGKHECLPPNVLVLPEQEFTCSKL